MPPVPDSSGPIRAFAYVNAEKAGLYRAVMGLFMAAKESFTLHLRPEEVAQGLGARPDLGAEVPASLADGVSPALAQLCDWGNLEAYPDTAEVATVEDFYRPRYLYRLTAEGEAAERALAVFRETLEQPGELQTAALADIRVFLEDLLACSRDRGADGMLDEAEVHRALENLQARFEGLTSRAQAFMGSLQRTIDLHGIDVEAFLAYKETLIDYLERFIGELVVATADVAAAIARVEAAGVEELLAIAARRDLVDALAPTEADRQSALKAWRSRWRGLSAWFLGSREVPSQAEVLRSRARSAIPALLNTVASLHDRRTTRSDRVSDLRTLARWFAEADSEAEAHRLWRAAFGLAPARHLRIDAATVDECEENPVAPQASWLEAPPLRLAPRLRQTGRFRRRGRPESVVDRSREKRLLADLAREEAQQIAGARRRLATGRPVRLSHLGKLDPLEFGLFLDLLGEALASRVRPDEVAEATSSDGTLRIRLEPLLGAPPAVLVTSEGRFSGPDHLLTVEDVFAAELVEAELLEVGA